MTTQTLSRPAEDIATVDQVDAAIDLLHTELGAVVVDEPPARHADVDAYQELIAGNVTAAQGSDPNQW